MGSFYVPLNFSVNLKLLSKYINYSSVNLKLFLEYINYSNTSEAAPRSSTSLE